MHADQIYIDEDIACELIYEQFPEYGNLPIVVLQTMGTTNAIFRVGETMTARFPLRSLPMDESTRVLKNEASAAREFASCSSIPTPVPAGIGQPRIRFPMAWSMQTWIDGDIATHDDLARSTKFANEIANLILCLRNADTKGRTFDCLGRGGDLKDHDDWVGECLEKSIGLLNVPKLTSMWARLRMLPRMEPDCMNHKDLIPANLLVQNESLVGVLDCGSFGPADPSLDLVVAWHLFEQKQREHIRDRLGSHDLQWQRGAAWAFQQAIGLVWYYQKTNPTMATLGRSTLSRLLEDPEISR